MEKEYDTFMGIRTSAILEILLFFTGALLIDTLLLDSSRFAHVCPHPFWIIVLLIAAQYGTAEGLLAAAASALVLLLFNLPEQSIGQSSYDYLFSLTATPLQWLIAAVALGELRMKHVRERRTLKQSLADSEEREEKITQSYQWTKELKEKLELRIAGQLRSTVVAYQAARSMESLSPVEVLSGLGDLVRAVLNPEKFSVYLLEGTEMTASLTHGWQEAEPFARHFGSGSTLYSAVIGSRARLCVVNAEQEGILAGQGVLAGPLVDKASGDVLGMLKIEKLGFTDLNLSSIETFSAMCEWAGSAIANARTYQVAREDTMVNPEHNLFTQGYFRRYADYITALGKRVGFDVSMLVIRLVNAEALSGDTRLIVARVLSEAVHRVLRSVDLAFDYQGTGDDYSIVLPATTRAGAEAVLTKIQAELSAHLTGHARDAAFSFSVQTLAGK